MHPRDPHDGNPASAWPPLAEQSPRFLQPTGVDIGLHQGKLDQIVLCAAAANALVFAGEWRQCFNRAGRIPALECRQAARQRRKVRAGRVAPFARQFRHLASTGIECGVISHDSLHQQNMQISEPVARPWQCAVRIAIQPAPRRGVARLTSEFGTPQKRRPIGDFLLRPAAVPVERERVPVQPQCFFPIAGLDFAEGQMPA